MEKQWNAVSFIAALVIGFLVGIALWQLPEKLPQTIYGPAIVLVGFVAYLLFMYRRVSNEWLFGVSLVLFAWVLIAFQFISHGDLLRDFMLFAFPLFALVILGFVTVGITEEKWSVVAALFHKYINKSVEVICLSAVFVFALIITSSFVYALFRIVDFSIPPEVIKFLQFTLISMVPFVALGLAYDFEKPLGGQKESFAILNILSKLFVAVSFFSAVFLFIYLVALVPSAFQRILQTGNAGITFLSMIAVNVISIYFITVLLNRQNIGKKLLIALKVALGALVVESLVMNGVTLYAMTVRIGQYGYTFERYVVLFVTIFLFLLLGAYGYSIVRHLFMKIDINDFTKLWQKATIIGLALLAIFLLKITSVVDLEQLSIRSQFAVAEAATDPTVHMDRFYLTKTGLATVDFLKQQYPNASLKMKLDILLSIYAFDTPYNLDNTNKAYTKSVIETLEAGETDQRIKGFILFLKSSFTADYGKYMDMDQCANYVEGLLNLPSESAFKFCVSYNY